MDKYSTGNWSEDSSSLAEIKEMYPNLYECFETIAYSTGGGPDTAPGIPDNLVIVKFPDWEKALKPLVGKTVGDLLSDEGKKSLSLYNHYFDYDLSALEGFAHADEVVMQQMAALVAYSTEIKLHLEFYMEACENV